MNPSTFIFLVQLVCFLVFLPISQCSSSSSSSSQVFFPMDENLIEQTCRKTPDYDICLYLLKYNGGSGIYTANRTRMADVMIDVVGLRATTTLNKINELLGKTPGDQSLQGCKTEYTMLVGSLVPAAKYVIYTSKHQDAGKLMHDIPDAVGRLCEDKFGGSSPITDFNSGVRIVAGIAEAIIGQLG